MQEHLVDAQTGGSGVKTQDTLESRLRTPHLKRGILTKEELFLFAGIGSVMLFI